MGLAVSDPGGSIASPLATLEVKGDLAAQVAAAVRAVADYDIGQWVVGLPINMDGTESAQAALTRRFAAALEKACGQTVHLWDERLSSHQADDYLAEAQLTAKKRKARRDRVAAQVILQSFLDAR